jgi:hypothetical protein
MKESQRYKYERDNDLLRELRGCVAIIERVKERTTERNAETLAISLTAIAIVAKDMDAVLVGIKERVD